MATCRTQATDSRYGLQLLNLAVKSTRRIIRALNSSSPSSKSNRGLLAGWALDVATLDRSTPSSSLTRSQSIFGVGRSSFGVFFFTARPVCPQSSRALFPRFRARVPLQATAAAVRGAARNQGGTSHNASELIFWPAAPEKLLPLLRGSCELHGL